MALTCFVLTGSLMAFGGEQNEQTEGYQSQKEGYQKKAEAKLKEFKVKLEELKVKAAGLKDESKAKFDQEMKVLKKKEAAANKKLGELKTASAKTWEKIKTDLDKAIEDLNRQYNKMMSHFKKT